MFIKIPNNKNLFHIFYKYKSNGNFKCIARLCYRSESLCIDLYITFVNHICKPVDFIMKYKLINFASNFYR